MVSITGWTYSAADGLGSVRQRLDGSGGIDGELSYRPFGTPLEGDGGDPYGFTGEAWDADAGLLYLRARYYDPYLNQFISPDTIIPDFSFPPSVHKYLYAYNNPLRFVDPSGHAVCFPGTPYNPPFCIPTEEVPWEAILQTAGGLAVAVGAVMMASEIAEPYQQAMLWVLDDPGPEYPLPTTPDDSLLVTYPLPGGNTIPGFAEIFVCQDVLNSPLLAAQDAGAIELAAHLAMSMGFGQVGGIPPHPGGQDPEGRDQRKIAREIRNFLRNIRKAVGNQHNLQSWLEQIPRIENPADVMKQLESYGWTLKERALPGVDEAVAEEIVQNLTELGVFK
jgi:RHS repeat-associated protein